ncbi:MAG: hypothetical protein JWM18_2511 [Chloroflexi bacterium]|jgi:hypothetical protein|nr:hypothetical protein [Chloroflexota bacterium]
MRAVGWPRAVAAEREVPAGRALRGLAPAAVLAGYALLAVLLLSSTWFAGESRWVGVDTDPPLFMWYLRWTPWALSHGHTPLLTDHLQYPGGANLMWNTSMVVPALVLWPVTATLGPVIAYNLLATAALALSGWCAFLVFRRHTRSGLAAAVGGLVYGFSPYMLTQSYGHLNLTLAVFPPLLLLIADEALVRQRLPRPLLGGALGLLVSLQLLTGEELLATSAIVAGLGVAILAALRPGEVRRRAPYALAVLGIGAAVAMLLCAYPLGVQFLGPRRPGSILPARETYIADLRAFVVPALSERLAPFGRYVIADSEAYVGVPLLCLLAVTVVALRRHRVVVFAALLGLGAAILAMGPRLHVDGRRTGLPLPWRLVDHLPLLETIVTLRLMLYAYLMIGLILAVALGRLLAQRPGLRLAGAAAVALALVPLFPATPFPSTPATVPEFFRGEGVGRIPEGSAALVTPVLDLRTMLWQAEAGMRYRMPQGGVFTPGPDGPNFEMPPSALRTRLFGLQTGGTPPQTLAGPERGLYLRDLATMGVSSVVVGAAPGSAGEAQFFRVLLGREPESAGGVSLWRNVTTGVPAG